MTIFHDDELLSIIRDDCPYSDITTEGLGIGDVAATLRMTARHDMVLCGVEEAARMFVLAGASARAAVSSGAEVPAGGLILEVSGEGRALHRTYKMAQTLMEILSGISTAARAIVTAARRGNPQCHVVCTRKHMPGMKRAAIRAIEAGGASPHRLGLSDYVLVFDTHRVLLEAGGPLKEHLTRLRGSAPERRLAAEADSIEDALLLVEAGADVLQVDKFTPEQVRELRAKLPAAPIVLAVAGGVNASNAEAYAKAGADVLVTSAPYYAPPRDVKVTFAKV
jgi:molybdenum transport protein